jgi:hypothetical protein
MQRWSLITVPRDTHGGNVTSDDPALDALRVLDAAMEQTVAELSAARVRIQRLFAERAAGHGWHHIVEQEGPPLVVETVTAALDRLSTAGSRFRRAQARALHQAGLSMERVASLFGVTRQRVSALLREPE